ncbi:ABC transporter permease [Candidatus Bathyarchaeota archaeon]|nr:MAG: ABC transporter permease [Candidatus Bathyarchaeota archaeon]
MSVKKTGIAFITLFKAAPLSSKVNVIAGAFFTSILLIFVIFGPIITPQDPYEFTENILSPPSSVNIMGTDNLGRDLLSRLIFGSRYSLGISLVAVGLSLFIGLVLGSSSGFFGGNLDRIMMLIMDALYVFPSFIYMLVLVVVLGPGLWQTTLAISIGRIPYNYRLIRSLTISIKERGFIEAERVLGADNWYIIRTHIMPYYLSILFVALSLGMASGTLAISGLGFLGLGIPPPTPEWGTELASGRNFLLGGHWWLVVFPGFFVMIAMLGFNLLSEGLDAMLNPTIRRLQ